MYYKLNLLLLYTQWTGLSFRIFVRSPAFIISVRVLGNHGGDDTSAEFSENTETAGEFINVVLSLKEYNAQCQSFLVKSFLVNMHSLKI